MAPRETEDNAYAKFWGDKQRALWYVIVFLDWSIERRSVTSSYQGSKKGAKATGTLLVIPLINGRCHF